MSLKLEMGSGVVLLDLNRVGFGDKSLPLWIDGVLDALSDCGVALLE